MGKERFLMSHPLDDELRDTMIHRWLLPPFRAIAVQPLILGMAAVLSVLLLWFATNISASQLGVSYRTAEFVDALALSFFGFCIGVVFYKIYAEAEGSPYGVGWTVQWSELPLRAACLFLIWLVAQVLMVLALRLMSELIGRGFAGAFGQGRSVIGAALGLSLALSVILPWALLLGFTQLMSIVLLVRTQSSPIEAFTTAFRVLWSDPMRVVFLVGLCVFAFCLVLSIAVWLSGPIGLLTLLSIWVHLASIPAWAGALLYLAVLMWSYAFWFVLERAYLPELGLDPEAETAAEDGSSPVLETALEKLKRALQREQDSDNIKAAAVAVSLRRKEVSWPEVEALTAALLPAQRNALYREIALALGAAQQWAALADLMQRGLADDTRFLADRPELILPYSRGLLGVGRHELSLRLLAPFLREQRARPEHLDAVLTSARLLMTHAGKPELARKMLEHFKAAYPDEPQIPQLIKILGP